MSIFYHISLKVYYLAIYLAQFFNPKAKKWILGRKNWEANLPRLNDKNVIWFHCASLGEFDQGLPLMNKMKEADSKVFLLVTFFSPSGYEHYHKRNHLVDFACYLPLDTKKNAKRFFTHFPITQCFFVKYEFWYNFIFEAKKSKAKVYSICAIFRKEHRYFSWYGGFFRKILRLIDHFFVQNEDSIHLLESIGIKNVTLVGDMRFDRVIDNKKNAIREPEIENFLEGTKAFILGSTWSVDELFLEEFISEYAKNQKIILAPHDIKENHLLEIENRFQGQICRYSNLKGAVKPFSILLIDCIGKLSNIYQYGKFAYIGGGFTGSLHNILEPAVFGLPVVFGPKHKRFPEAQLFIDKGVGFSISEKSQIGPSFLKLEENLENTKIDLEKLILQQGGAVNEIFAFLEMKRG